MRPAGAEGAFGEPLPVLLARRLRPGTRTPQHPHRAGRAELLARDPGTRAIYLPDLDLLAWRFPDDPGLLALPELVDPARAAVHLPGAAWEGSHDCRIDPGRLDVEVVRYQPETSCTIRYDVKPAGTSAPVTVFAKLLAGDTTPTLTAAHQRLWAYAATTPALRIAEPLGADPRLSVLWTRGVLGSSLGGALKHSRVASLAHDVALLLASLHASGVAVGSRVTVDGCVAEAEKKAAKLVVASPRTRAVVDTVTAEMLDAPNGPVLVDLDSMVTGDPELDVAELSVDLAMGDLPAATVRKFSGALLAAYERHAAGRTGPHAPAPARRRGVPDPLPPPPSAGRAWLGKGAGERPGPARRRGLGPASDRLSRAGRVRRRRPRRVTGRAWPE